MESNNNNSSGKPLTTDQQSSVRTSSTPNPQSTPINHNQSAPVSALESLIAAAKTDTDVYNNNEFNHTPQRDNNNVNTNEPPSTGRFQLTAVQQLQNITVPIGELNLDAFPNPTGDGIIIKNIGKQCQSKGRLHIGDRIVSLNGGSVNAIEDIHRHDGSAERRFVVYRATKSDNTAPAPSSTRASADNGNADTPLRNNTSAPSTKSSGRIAKSNLVIKAPPTVKRRESLTTLQQLSGVAACDSSDNDEASNTEKEKSSGNEEEDVGVNSNYTEFTVTYYEGDRYDFGVTGYDEDSGAYTIGFKDGFISESDDCLMDTDLLLEISGYNIKNMIPFPTKGGCPSDRLVRNLIRDALQPVTLTFLRPNNVESESEEEDEPISPEKVTQEVVDLAEDYSEGDSEDESDSEEDEVEIIAVNKKRVTTQLPTEDDEEDESMEDEEEEEEGVVFDGGDDYDDGDEEEVEEEVVVERDTGDTSPTRRSATAASNNNGSPPRPECDNTKLTIILNHASKRISNTCRLSKHKTLYEIQYHYARETDGIKDEDSIYFVYQGMRYNLSYSTLSDIHFKDGDTIEVIDNDDVSGDSVRTAPSIYFNVPPNRNSMNSFQVRSSSFGTSSNHAGLRNPSQLCYVIAILQSAFNTLPFRGKLLSVSFVPETDLVHAIASRQYPRKFGVNNKVLTPAILAKGLIQLQVLFHHMEVNPGKVIDLWEFYSVFGIDASVTDDANDFFATLMKFYHECLDFNDYDCSVMGHVTEDVPDSDLTEPRQSVSPKKWYFTVSVNEDGATDVQQSINDEVTHCETLAGDNGWVPFMDEGKVTAKKGQSLHLSPNTVMIHVNRTAHSGRKGDLGRKLFNSVKIPKILELTCADGHVTEYQLQQIIMHRGESLNIGGHYFIFIYDPVNDKWYRFDDSRVTVETESCVMKEAMSHSKSNAYMLQYVSKDEFGNGNWSLSSSIGRVVETRAGSSIELDDNRRLELVNGSPRVTIEPPQASKSASGATNKSTNPGTSKKKPTAQSQKSRPLTRSHKKDSLVDGDDSDDDTDDSEEEEEEEGPPSKKKSRVTPTEKELWEEGYENYRMFDKPDSDDSEEGGLPSKTRRISPRTRSVTRKGLATQDTQLSEEGELEEEDTATKERRFYDMLVLSIISSNEVRIGSKIHKLQEPITYDNMSQDVNEQVQVQGLHTFDITLTTKTQSYPDHGIYFILLQTIGGKWKILYGMSKGNTYKNDAGLFQRIKEHMADADVLGEVITFFIPKTVVRNVETMVKMSMLDLRPLLSCGTEIAVFDTREAALLCLSTWANILPNFDRGSTSASIPANYNDLEGVQLTIDNYKDEEHKERRTAATSILPAGLEVIQEYYKEKRAKFEAMNTDERIQYMQELYDSFPEPEPGQTDNRQNTITSSNTLTGEWLKELRKDCSELSESQLQILQAPPFNFRRSHKERAEMQTAEAVSKRRALLEEWQLKYGAFTRPPKKNQTRLSKGLPKEYTDLGNLILIDIYSFRDYGKAKGPSKGKNGPEKNAKYKPVQAEMVAMYRDLDIVEFEDATNTTESSLITVEQLQAVHNEDDASDQAQGINEPEELTIAPPPPKRTRRTRTAEV